LSTQQIPYIRWGEYKSNDPKKPDILEIQIIDQETFPTTYSENLHVKLLVNNQWQERILPIQNYNSDNTELMQAWTRAEKLGKIKPDNTIKIHTWLGKSKKNPERNMRRFRIR